MSDKDSRTLSDTAGKSFSAAKRIWKEAQQALKEEKIEDKGAYIASAVAKRLGLSTEALILLGYDPALSFGSLSTEVESAEDEGHDSHLVAAFLFEFMKADHGEVSEVVEPVEDEMEPTEGFVLLTERASESEMTNYWRKILLNCPEISITAIAQATCDR